MEPEVMGIFEILSLMLFAVSLYAIGVILIGLFFMVCRIGINNMKF